MEPVAPLARLKDYESRAPSSVKILVVEDEPRLQRSLAKALREESYAVDTAGNGEEALFKAESSEYNVIILDVMMPGLDGWRVLGL
jgi:DNA-binding response OmpR family regulator